MERSVNQPSGKDSLSESEIEEQSARTLARLLSMSPRPHKPKPESATDASPKKRGRPVKAK